MPRADSSDSIVPLTQEEARNISDFFQVLGDATRIRLLTLLAHREWNVGELARTLNMAQPAISHQLKFLREGGIVKHRKAGRFVYYELDNPLINQLIAQVKQQKQK